MRTHAANECTDNQTTYTIYALTEPGETDVVVVARVRYIGKTKNPDRRFRQHLTRAGRGIRTHCYNWIRQLFAAGFVPNLEVLCNIDAVDADRVEKEMIARFRTLGAPLTNLADGGGGNPGWIPSLETRANMSAAHKGNKNSLGYHQSKEHIAKRVPALMGNKSTLGRHPSDETRAKMSAAKIGKKLSPEIRAKLSASHMGCHHSDERKLKISAALRVYWVTKKEMKK